MQEVLEKIIERFKKMDSITFSSFSKPLISIEDAIGIVETEAKKYNGGWILCSERLPEESGYYLVTYHEWSNGEFLPKFDDTYVKILHYQKSERFTGWNFPKCVDKRAEEDMNKEVIAWKPLPEPYSPERKSGNEK